MLHEEPSQLHALRNMHEENRMAKMVINQQDGQDGNQPGALGTDNARAAPLIFLARRKEKKKKIAITTVTSPPVNNTCLSVNQYY